MLQIERNGSGWILRAEQLLPASPDMVFPFFADAGNLDRLTPDWLHFRILTPLPVEMREGALIDYRLRLRGVPIRWRTEITCWEPPYEFVDEQIRGPYRKWIHRHTFQPHEAGTLMTDEVAYDVPGGAWVNRLFVEREISRIFRYRMEVMESIFRDPAGSRALASAETGHAGGPPRGRADS